MTRATRLGRRSFYFFLAALITVTAMLTIGMPVKAEAAANEFTVYLQAGHSPSSLGNGNIQNGIKESTLNEQLTQKTYQALKAKGINVRLLNPISLDGSLPSLIQDPPGERGQYAYYSPEPAMLTALTYPSRFDSSVTRQGDLVLCLHHNAYSDTSINGYEVYYANTTGGDYGRTADAAAKSKQAADLVGNHLKQGKFGISPRTPAVRENSSHNGITKNSPVPAVLVEAGYMTNSSDFAAARSSANQSIIAEKLALAVVEYRDTVWTGPAVTPSSPPSASTQPEESITASLYEVSAISASPAAFRIRTQLSSQAVSAKVVVWPVSEGETDAKTYPLTRESNGIYAANISTGDFGGVTGNYAFQLYATDAQGRTKYVAVGYGRAAEPSSGTSASVTETPWPSAAEIAVKKNTDTATSATLLARGVTDADGVSGVRFAVWSVEGGQDDLRWYSAAQQGSDWQVAISSADHKDRAGTYITHVYGTDGKKNDGIIGSALFTLGNPQTAGDKEPPKITGSLTYNLRTQNALSVGVSGVTDPSGVDSVRFAFWGAADQSDLAWYAARRVGNSWSCDIDLTRHDSPYRSYNCHVYATDGAGNDGILDGRILRLGTDTLAPKADRVAARVISSGTNLATLEAENVVDTDSGIGQVQFAVWTNKDGQDDLIWYNAEQRKDSEDYDVTITAQKHNDEKGPYSVHAYATDKAGNMALVGYTVFTFDSGDKTPPTAAGLSADAEVYAKQRAVFTAKDVSDDTGVAGVQIAVWKADNAETRKSYTAKRSGRQWSIAFDWSEEFEETGIYCAEAVATDYAGNQAVVGSCQVEVTDAALGGYPIMGTSAATVGQLVNYMASYNNWDDEWYGMSLPEFCQLYYDICEAEGVKAEVAISQMVHETGALRYGNLVVREQYNFAGIGATGVVKSLEDQLPAYRYTEEGVEAGINFTSVENGIKSHVQHLKGYATAQPLILPRAPEYDRYNYITKGTCPTVQDLSGKWAVDPTYSVKIMQFIETILSQSSDIPADLITSPGGGNAAGDEEMA